MHGLEMVELARLAGVSRATVSQIEEGRTKKPNKKVVLVLARMSGHSPDELFEKIETWRNQKTEEILPPRWKALLNLPSAVIPHYYPSFQHWRMELSDNPTHFASVLRINRLTVSKYERDQFVGGMPDTLAHALVNRLGITEDYLNALESLPPCLKTTN
jgi:transcriptional regulator with XRE-family HTH domain